jgi:hypothetical protein
MIMMRKETAAVRWPSCGGWQSPRRYCTPCTPKGGSRHRMSRVSPRTTAVADALVSAPAAVALADDFMQVGSTFKQENCPRRRELRGNTHTKWILAHAGSHRVSGE